MDRDSAYEEIMDGYIYGRLMEDRSETFMIVRFHETDQIGISYELQSTPGTSTGDIEKAADTWMSGQTPMIRLQEIRQLVKEEIISESESTDDDKQNQIIIQKKEPDSTLQPNPLKRIDLPDTGIMDYGLSMSEGSRTFLEIVQSDQIPSKAGEEFFCFLLEHEDYEEAMFETAFEEYHEKENPISKLKQEIQICIDNDWNLWRNY